MSDREQNLREALQLAEDELHEMALAQRYNIVPRNPDRTKKAFDAVKAAQKTLLAAEPATAPASESPIEGKWYSGSRGKPLQIKRPATAHDSDCQCVACKTDYPEAMPDDMPATAGGERPDKQGEHVDEQS